MFDMNTLLARLQNGETVDSIANDLSKALNDANEAYAAQRAAEEAAQKAAKEAAELQEKKRNEAKVTDLQAIIDELILWFETYYTNPGEEESVIGEIKAEDIIELIDGFNEIKILVKDLPFQVKGSVKGEPKKTCSCKKNQSPDSIISDFLRNMGW